MIAYHWIDLSLGRHFIVLVIVITLQILFTLVIPFVVTLDGDELSFLLFMSNVHDAKFQQIDGVVFEVMTIHVDLKGIC
jgi:hypothetical protein